MMPAIKFFGSLVPTPIYPGTIPIAQMTSDQLWNSYIRYIGAGAVAAAGLITLMKTMPTIVAALTGRRGRPAQGAAAAPRRRDGRTDRDLPHDGRARRLAPSSCSMMWACSPSSPCPARPPACSRTSRPRCWW